MTTPCPRATITVDTSGAQRVLWHVDDESSDADMDESSIVESVSAKSRLSKQSKKKKTARMTTGGFRLQPVIGRRDRIRLLILRRLLVVRVQESLFKMRRSHPRVEPGTGGGAVAVDEGNTDSDVLSENRPTMSLFPKGDTAYVNAERNGSTKIYHSLSRRCASMYIMERYLDIISLLPPTTVRNGIVGGGLFVERKVRQYGLVAEYTGNRISGRAAQRLNTAMDYHNVHPGLQAAVPSEDAIVDPRIVGNDSRFVNHSCTPNAELVEIDVRGRTVVFIIALRPLEADEEVLIDYRWYTGRKHPSQRVVCHCGSDNCRDWI